MQTPMTYLPETLILCIGNTRLHWGYFINDLLQATWDTQAVDRSQIATLLNELGKNGNFSATQTNFITPRLQDLGLPDPAQCNENSLDHTLNKTGVTLDKIIDQTFNASLDLAIIDLPGTAQPTTPKNSITQSNTQLNTQTNAESNLGKIPIASPPNQSVNSSFSPSPDNNPSQTQNLPFHYSQNYPQNSSKNQAQPPQNQAQPPQNQDQSQAQDQDQSQTQNFNSAKNQAQDQAQNSQFPPELCQRLQTIRRIWLISVVPEQTQAWQTELQQRGYAIERLTLADLPLQATYPTLGIDRALNCVGALWQHHAPCLVVDGGTALTYSAVEPDTSQVGQRFGQFLGGAILPGLRLQYQALGQQTAQLPWLNTLSTLNPASRPLPRWAKETTTAIQSGILYTIGAGLAATIADWLHQYPAGHILLTGGDAPLLQAALTLHLQTQTHAGLKLAEDFEGETSGKQHSKAENREPQPHPSKRPNTPFNTQSERSPDPITDIALSLTTTKTTTKTNPVPILGRSNLHLEPQLMFWGIQALLNHNFKSQF